MVFNIAGARGENRAAYRIESGPQGGPARYPESRGLTRPAFRYHHMVPETDTISASALGTHWYG